MFWRYLCASDHQYNFNHDHQYNNNSILSHHNFRRLCLLHNIRRILGRER